MKITIHRGISQIGGCITEIQSGDDRIMIDLGSNLPGTEGDDFTGEQIREKTAGVRAILYTHYHGDHVGHFAEAADVPQYIGKGAKEVMLCKERRIHPENLPLLEAFCTYEARQRLTFGRLTVTPFFCSHSAFDSFMFLIEDGENRVLHTGDFRTHGYLGKGLEKLVPAFVGQVDALITEGTMLSRGAEHVPTEAELKAKAIGLLSRKGQSHHFFALCSSTDIDRLATFHAACKETGAWLVVDAYQKEVLDIFTRHAGQHQQLYVFDRLKVLGEDGLFLDNIRRDGFIMSIRASQYDRVYRMRRHVADAELIYSVWRNYWKGTEKQIDENVRKIADSFEQDKVHYLHTSGHATAEAIHRLIQMTNPRKKIIVIHKDKNSDLGLLHLTPEASLRVVFGPDKGNEITI